MRRSLTLAFALSFSSLCFPGCGSDETPVAPPPVVESEDSLAVLPTDPVPPTGEIPGPETSPPAKPDTAEPGVSQGSSGGEGLNVRTVQEEGFLRGLCLTPDGTTLIAANEDKTIQFRNIATWELVKTLQGAKYSISELAISSDGTFLISAGGDDDHGELLRWDLTSDAPPQQLPPHEYEYRISNVALSPDDQQVASLCLGRGRVLNLAKPEDARQFSYDASSLTSSAWIQYAPDGNRVVVASANGEASVLETEDWEETKTLRAAGSCSGNPLVMDADAGGFLLADSTGKPFRAWSFAGESRAEFVPHEHGVVSLALTRDGKYLIGGGKDGLSDPAPIRIWERASGKPVAEWTGHGDNVFYLALASNDELLVSASRKSGDTEIKVWSLEAALKQSAPQADAEELTASIYSPKVHGRRDAAITSDGNTLLSFVGPDVEVHAMDQVDEYSSPLFLARLHSDGSSTSDQDAWLDTEGRPELLHIELSRDGKVLLTADSEYHIRVWDLPTRTLKATHKLHDEVIDVLAIAPDGQSFLSGNIGSPTLLCCEVASGRKLWTVDLPREVEDYKNRNRTSRVRFSQQGDVVLATRSRELLLLDAATGQTKARHATKIARPQRMVESPDSTLVAITGETEGNPNNGTVVHVFVDGKFAWEQTQKNRAVLALTFTSGGEFLLTAVERGQIHLRAARDGQPVRVLPGESFRDIEAVAATAADRVALFRHDQWRIANVPFLLDPKLLKAVDTFQKLNAQIYSVGEDVLLRLDDSSATDADLAALTEIDPPLRLQISWQCNLKDAGLLHLKGRTNVVELDLNDNDEFSDAGFAALAGHTDLRNVDISGCDNITDRSANILTACSKLQRLAIGGSGMTGESFKVLKNNPQLKQLHLSIMQFTPEQLSPLATLTELRELDLSYNEPLTAEATQYLKNLTRLEQLDLGDCGLDDAALQPIAGLIQLKSLGLSDNDITGDGCAPLAGLINLKSLQLDDTPIGDAGLQHLAGLTKLESLNLSGTELTGSSFASLAKLTRLQELTLRELPDFTGEHLNVLVNMPQLGSLNLHQTAVTDTGLKQIAGLKQLTELALPQAMTDKGFESLKDLINLENIHFHPESKFTGPGLVHLKNLEQLKSLELGDTQVTDEGLASLTQLQQMEAIGLTGTKITDAALKHLLDLPRLRRLELTRTAITDAGLAQLAKIQTLESLELYDSKTTQAARDQLEKDLPNLDISD